MEEAKQGTEQEPTPAWQPAAPTSDCRLPIAHLLDLGVTERIVKLRSGDRRYVHIFSPPTAEDWVEFERRARPTQIFRGDEVETRTNLREAGLELWRKRVARVDGYGELTGFDRVPTEHRIRAALGLDRVEQTRESEVGSRESEDDSETVCIALQGWWNGEFFPHLVHRFKRPLVEHELRYSEAAARSSLILPRIGRSGSPGLTGGRTGQNLAIESRRLPLLPTLIALYDELIVSVEGYAFQDSGFRIQDSGKDKMDTPHKSAAVRALFSRETVSLDEEETVSSAP